VKHAFNVSAFQIHDTLQTTSPFIDAAVNQALRQCTSFQQAITTRETMLVVEAPSGKCYSILTLHIVGKWAITSYTKTIKIF